MDSFYGAPRRPPAPPKINPIERVPVVPEVSVIDNSFFPFRAPQNLGIRPQNLYDKPQSYKDSSIYKKHVRFKNSAEPIFGKENVPETIKTAPDLNGKTFRQIYMANVPDRHLDLSIFEPQREEIKCEKHFGKVDDSLKEKSLLEEDPLCNTYRISSYKEFMNLRSLENAKSKTPKTYEDENLRCRQMYEKSRPNLTLATARSFRRNEMCTQTEPQVEKCTEIATPNDEPTIKDLFRIIQQQNEQIMLLQRQVNNLKTSIRQPEIEPVEKPDLTNSPSKKGLFSFDVKATSFEFSFRPQHNKYRKNDFLEPKIQEIVECEQSNSLHLDESLDVQKSYVSNVPSIDIEMDEYHNSDDDEESEIGLTFYKDLMGQVNKVLKKAQKQSECQMTPNTRQDLNGQAMKAVKQATLQHLKNIGVNLSPIQESSEVTGGSDLDVENCNESEISCAVQQLLMKYLPSEKLARVVNKAKNPPKLQERKLKNLNSEFSFATLQYMQKYNLMGDKKNILENNNEKRAPELAQKILDVTALKLQPKLL